MINKDNVNKIIEEFIQKHIDIPFVISRNSLRGKLIDIEDFLTYLVERRGYLLHGSTRAITDGQITTRNGMIFATNSPGIAIMKSIFSNEKVNLSYPRNLSENRLLELDIQEIHQLPYKSVGEGNVYILESNGFSANPESNYEFINTEASNVRIIGIVKTRKEDFTSKYKYKVSRLT